MLLVGVCGSKCIFSPSCTAHNFKSPATSLVVAQDHAHFSFTAEQSSMKDSLDELLVASKHMQTLEEVNDLSGPSSNESLYCHFSKLVACRGTIIHLRHHHGQTAFHGLVQKIYL